MTQVQISMEEGRCLLVASGHAEYAEPGKDIVCAGISALLYGLAGYIINGGGELDELTMEPGLVRIAANGPVLEAYRQTYIGLRHLEQKYPENLRLILYSCRNSSGDGAK